MALASPGLAAGIVIALAYAEGTPFFYGGSTIPMALPTAVALVAVNLALLTTAISLIRRPAEGAGGPAFRPVSSRGRIERNLVAIIGVLILGIALAGLFSVRSQQASIIGMTLIVLLLGAVFTALHRLRRINEGFLYAKLSAETERRSMAERLALVTRHANDIILLMDENKRIVEANDRAVTTYGYTLQEFRQLPPGGLRPGSTKGHLPEQLDFSNQWVVDSSRRSTGARTEQPSP